MKISEIKTVLSNLAEEANNLIGTSRETPEFRGWWRKTIRRLTRIYGEHSQELSNFRQIDFFLILSSMYYDDEEERQIAHVGSCLQEAILLFEDLAEDLTLFTTPTVETPPTSESVSKVFISHSSKDRKLVGEIVHLLSLIGVQDKSIFCTSLEGYGIPLGEDWVQTLKSEVSGKVIVLFVISENYYKSIVSLCEMGAAWALSKKHIPILIPPLDYKDMEGVIPLTQGFKIVDKHKWTQLKSQLEPLLGISPKAPEIWESRRDEILERIQALFTP